MARLKLFLQSGPRAALAALCLSVFAADASLAQDTRDALRVTIDRAKVVRIARSADTVIIGNPAIANATIQDAQTIVLTGRTYGVTNLIVLDIDGDPIVDETIVVAGHEGNTVRIYRQAVRETYACSPVCQPTLTIGDEHGGFLQRQEQIEARNEFSTKANDER